MTKIELNFICEEDKYLITTNNQDDKIFEINKADLKFDGKMFFMCFYNSTSYENYELILNNNNNISREDKIVYTYVKQIIDNISNNFLQIQEKIQA